MFPYNRNWPVDKRKNQTKKCANILLEIQYMRSFREYKKSLQAITC